MMKEEVKRHCGARKIGGIYLVQDAIDHLSCIALPYNVGICPCCFEGFKFSRNFKWFIPNKLFANIDETCSGLIKNSCPMKNDCPLKTKDKAGIMWVGKQFYTPEEFVEEAKKQGVSKRIAAVPNNFKIGETWVFLAHQTAGRDPKTNKRAPAIFYVFKPTRIEKIVSETQYKNHEEMDKLRAKGIIPLVVADDDFDHRGSAYDRIHGKSLFED